MVTRTRSHYEERVEDLIAEGRVGNYLNEDQERTEQDSEPDKDTEHAYVLYGVRVGGSTWYEVTSAPTEQQIRSQISRLSDQLNLHACRIVDADTGKIIDYQKLS